MAPADGNDAGTAHHNVVFIDTSLQTHLAMIVSDSDTVSDFKEKIMLEHRQLFPAIGEIRVECLKVKQRGNFYHLSDSMLVKNAFDAAKRNWFVSVDASCLEQNDGIQHLGKHKDGDQLALPWVTHSHSIDRQDNHGSPSVRSKIVPYMNQKVSKVDQLTSGESFKGASKNVEKDRSCNDMQLDYDLQEKRDTVNADVKSKKRTRDVHNESSLKDTSGSGPSAKKKRKTQRVKSNVKASEENIALTYDIDEVNDENANINNEDSFNLKSKGKDSSDENNRTNIGENCSVLDQVATVVPSIQGAGSETVGDVAMVVENNIQQEMSNMISQKEKELVQKSAIQNELHSSLMRTSDCEHDAAGVTSVGHKKRSAKHKAAEKEVFSTSFIEKLHNTNKDAIESSSQQDVGTNGQECAGDQIDKYKEDSEISLKQKPELKLPERKKGAMGPDNIGEGKRRKTKKLFKHSDNLVGDISSTIPASVVDERKMNEDSEKALVDAQKGDDVIVKEVEISLENMEEKSRKEFRDTNDVANVTNEENVWPHSESMVNNDAEISTLGKNTSQVNAQGILDNLEKQNEMMDDTMKKRKKRKAKKSSGRNEDESITKHVDGDISSTVLASVIDERKVNEVSEKTLMDARKSDDVIVEQVDMSVDNLEEKSRKEFTDANDVANVTNKDNALPHSESMMNNGAKISTLGKITSQVNAQGILDNLEKQNEMMDDTTKKRKKRKTKKSSGRDEDESITKNLDGDISSTVLASVIDERKVNEVSEKTLMDAKKGDDVIVEEVEMSVDNMEEKSRKEFTDTNDVVNVTNEENVLSHSESMMNNDAEISTLGKETSQANAQGISDNLEKQNESMGDTTKKKKKRKSKKSAGRNEDESLTKQVDGGIRENVKEGESNLPDADRNNGDTVKEKDAQSYHDGLVGETNKNNKSPDLPTKHQSTEVSPESKKSQSVDHHHFPEKTSKNVTASEVSKVNNEVDISEDGSHELDFRDYFAPGHQPKKIAPVDNRKDMKKTKDDSRNDRSRKLVSKNENNKVSIDVLKDPNITKIDELKTPKMTKKVDAQKTSKQQSISGQTRVKSLKKISANRSQQSKSVLNTPGTIFEDDSDDNATENSDSSTRTPSGESSSSSSFGESSYSRYSRRNMSHARKKEEATGKNNTNSQSKPKNILMSDLLRRSSGYKKAKVTASSQVEDSQPVDFVPDSQPMGK